MLLCSPGFCRTKGGSRELRERETEHNSPEVFLFESEGKILPSGIVQQAIHDSATTNQSAAGEGNKREREGDERVTRG